MEAVIQRVDTAWMKWRKLTGVICNKKSTTENKEQTIQDGSKTGPAVWEQVLGCGQKGGGVTDENRDENVEVDSWSEWKGNAEK